MLAIKIIRCCLLIGMYVFRFKVRFTDDSEFFMNCSWGYLAGIQEVQWLICECGQLTSIIISFMYCLLIDMAPKMSISRQIF